MHRPALVTPPDSAPVSLADAKVHLRVDHDDDDALIEGLIGSATEHLDGWIGVGGFCLAVQTWRQDFDAFSKDMRLALGPVIDVTSVAWRNEAGTLSTVSSSNYDLRTDSAGRSLIRFDIGFSFPSGLHESRAVSITYRAGHAVVPNPLRVAIMMLVAHWYGNREAVAAVASTALPMGVASLIAPYRRVGL